jgi:hypothetical protein
MEKNLIWVAISFDGREQIFFIEEKENTDVYEDILNYFCPEIKRL